eukprot:4896464-Amphidinium_carterae.2
MTLRRQRASKLLLQISSRVRQQQVQARTPNFENMHGLQAERLEAAKFAKVYSVSTIQAATAQDSVTVEQDTF